MSKLIYIVKVGGSSNWNLVIYTIYINAKKLHVDLMKDRKRDLLVYAYTFFIFKKYPPGYWK